MLTHKAIKANLRRTYASFDRTTSLITRAFHWSCFLIFKYVRFYVRQKWSLIPRGIQRYCIRCPLNSGNCIVRRVFLLLSNFFKLKLLHDQYITRCGSRCYFPGLLSRNIYSLLVFYWLILVRLFQQFMKLSEKIVAFNEWLRHLTNKNYPMWFVRSINDNDALLMRRILLVTHVFQLLAVMSRSEKVPKATRWYLTTHTINRLKSCNFFKHQNIKKKLIMH